VERARVAVAAVLGDFAVVDVPGQLGGVLVFLILGLEGPDADPVLLAQDHAPDPDVLDHLAPVALVKLHQVVVDPAAEGVGLLREPTGPWRSRIRRSVPYPSAAERKKSTSCMSAKSSPKMPSAPLSKGSLKK